MSAGYTIRLASIEDLATVVAQRRAMFEDMGRVDNHAQTDEELQHLESASREWFASRLASGSYKAWIAHATDGSVAGGSGLLIFDWPPTLMDISGRRGMILNIWVHRDHRRRGLARKLTQTAVDWCKANGIRTVILHASTEGRPLYEQLGFRSTNEMRLLL